MTGEDLKNICTAAGVTYNNLDDFKKKLSLLIFDNSSAFYNDIPDPLHQIVEVNYEKEYFHFREAYKGELLETYVPFEHLQRISFKSTYKITDIHGKPNHYINR